MDPFKPYVNLFKDEIYAILNVNLIYSISESKEAQNIVMQDSLTDSVPSDSSW
jgi:hypothetical protein